MSQEDVARIADGVPPREWEAVELVGGQGLSIKAAAARMAISPHTVEDYLQRTRDRIGSELSPRKAVTRFYWRVRSARGWDPPRRQV